ncbi:hypothetical protein HF1_08680 [Mycoplasma haemofelis str. Langford 1]|uniref:Uncharacterized protein n=1 Tax=Mycoplasma haemofelis (strain Langford 1) TaxID=941640 RepID=E8ZIA5_MYCHL|nr:hypothetical protein [Mycoplasma haemofelis]CBY92876.1 hypothetical protein HF1_08680 [Mycoplasma haemofelis str. Langford 1]
MNKLAAASTAGVGAASAGGFGVYNFYFKDSEDRSLRAKLISEKFTILTNKPEDRQHWEELKGKYNESKNIANKVFKVSDKEVTVDDLKDLCKDYLSREQEDLYSKVKRWCIVPVTVDNHLRNLKLTPLSTQDSGNTDQDKWEALAGGYKNSNDKITGLEVADKNAWASLKNKCKELISKKNYEDEFDTNLKSSMRWCVQQGNKE